MNLYIKITTTYTFYTLYVVILALLTPPLLMTKAGFSNFIFMENISFWRHISLCDFD
jgi:hypothetical protein